MSSGPAAHASVTAPPAISGGAISSVHSAGVGAAPPPAAGNPVSPPPPLAPPLPMTPCAPPTPAALASASPGAAEPPGPERSGSRPQPVVVANAPIKAAAAIVLQLIRRPLGVQGGVAPPAVNPAAGGRVRFWGAPAAGRRFRRSG